MPGPSASLQHDGRSPSNAGSTEIIENISQKHLKATLLLQIPVFPYCDTRCKRSAKQQEENLPSIKLLISIIKLYNLPKH